MIICFRSLSDDIEETSKVKENLIRGVEQVEFGQSWLFDRLGRSHSCSLPVLGAQRLRPINLVSVPLI